MQWLILFLATFPTGYVAGVSLRTATCLKTVVGVKQGHVTCKILSHQRSLFCVGRISWRSYGWDKFEVILATLSLGSIAVFRPVVSVSVCRCVVWTHLCVCSLACCTVFCLGLPSLLVTSCVPHDGVSDPKSFMSSKSLEDILNFFRNHYYGEVNIIIRVCCG